MPELPEAETLARGLCPLLSGRTIERVRVHRPDVLRTSPHRFRAALRGRLIRGVGRRAKKIVIALSEDDRLVVNLGMTGWLAPVGPLSRAPPPTHAALTFELDGPDRLVFDDVRRFGRVALFGDAEFERWSAGLGPEPLGAGFTARTLAARLARSRSPIRSWLLDQRRIAGIGNIYAAEALFRARVHPLRPANSLSHAEARALHRAIRAVLREAVRAGGTTLRNYRDVRGEPGSFRLRLRAYGRAGKPCPRCNTPVERIVFGQRSAFLCPWCQPAPPAT